MRPGPPSSVRKGRVFSQAVALIILACLAAVLVGAVWWRISSVGDVASWEDLVEAVPGTVAQAEDAMLDAEDALAEAERAGFEGAEVEVVEEAVLIVGSLSSEISGLEQFRTVTPIANDESPLAVLDPYAHAQSGENVEVSILIPSDYRELMREYGAAKQSLGVAIVDLTAGIGQLHSAVAHYEEVLKQQRMWSDSRAKLEQGVQAAESRAEEVRLVLPTLWHQVTRDMDQQLADAAALLTEHVEVPQELPELGEQIAQFGEARDTLARTMETAQAEMEREREAQLSQPAQDGEEQEWVGEWTTPTTPTDNGSSTNPTVPPTAPPPTVDPDPDPVPEPGGSEEAVDPDPGDGGGSGE